MNDVQIRARVRRILKEAGCTGPSVDVERIVKLHGIRLKQSAFPPDYSGMIVRDASQVVIGVNETDPAARQRFTIAHEFGHFILHPEEGVHIDKTFRVQFRGPRTETGLDPKEVEANRFAAELLMPLDFLRADLRDTDIYPDLRDADAQGPDELIENLAKRYDVSRQAMTIRLTHLGLGDILGG